MYGRIERHDCRSASSCISSHPVALEQDDIRTVPLGRVCRVVRLRRTYDVTALLEEERRYADVTAVTGRQEESKWVEPPGRPPLPARWHDDSCPSPPYATDRRPG